MAIWAVIVFVFGIILFLLYVFDLFASFAPWIWSIILFVVSVGMLSRIWIKEKAREKEKLAQRVNELEQELNDLQKGKSRKTDQGN
jgi:membrane protein implicated in regulation of membrane protease activity